MLKPLYQIRHQCSPKVTREITMRPGIDERWYVGTCSHCDKKEIQAGLELDKALQDSFHLPITGFCGAGEGGPRHNASRTKKSPYSRFERKSGHGDF